MNKIFPQALSYFRFIFEMYILRNNLLFNVLIIMSVIITVFASIGITLFFVLMLFRSWVIIRKYCLVFHEHPVYYLAAPYRLISRTIGLSTAFYVVFPVLYFSAAFLLHLFFYKTGIGAVPVSAALYISMAGNFITFSTVMFYAAVYWKSNQLKKIISIVLLMASVLIILVFIFVRIRYSKYFFSFIIPDLAGLSREMETVSSSSSGIVFNKLFQIILRISFIIIIPVSAIILSWRKLKKIGN